MRFAIEGFALFLAQQFDELLIKGLRVFAEVLFHDFRLLLTAAQQPQIDHVPFPVGHGERDKAPVLFIDVGSLDHGLAAQAVAQRLEELLGTAANGIGNIVLHDLHILCALLGDAEAVFVFRDKTVVDQIRQAIALRRSYSSWYGETINGVREIRLFGLQDRRTARMEEMLEDITDTRSSNYLEDAATEIQVQGLELDYTCVLWDADMRCDNGKWTFYKFSNTTSKWSPENNEENRKYALNAYRVLLTRARQGMVICVPYGNERKNADGFPEDPTRLPEFYNGTYNYLKSLGLKELRNNLAKL